MPHSVDSASIAEGVEAVLALLGVVLLWKKILRAPGPVTPKLARWEAPVSSLFLFLSLAVGGAIAGEYVAASFLQRYSHRGPDAQIAIINLALEAGSLAGMALFSFVPGGRPRSAPAPLRSLADGAVTFLIVLPLIAATSVAWQAILRLCRLPVEAQDVVDLFVNAHSPATRGLVVFLAVVTAPVVEELFFRAALFGYLRTRWPRWLALGAPALLFGVLHVTWKDLAGLAALAPLTVLAIVFSLAYERTGRIGTSIVAHALFNLNVILLFFAGVNFT